VPANTTASKIARPVRRAGEAAASVAPQQAEQRYDETDHDHSQHGGAQTPS